MAASESFRFPACNVIKKETPIQFLWFCELFKNTYFVEDLWTAGSETPARLFKNTPSFTEHLQWLILTFLGFQPATLLKKRLRHRCFSANFAKFLRISSDSTPPDDCSCVYLSILRSCSDDLFSRVPLRNLFQVQVTGQCRFQIYFGTVWTVWVPPKNAFPCMFHVKTKWNIVHKYLKNKNVFKRLKYPSPNALNIRYFWTLSYNYWGFGSITKLSNP